MELLLVRDTFSEEFTLGTMVCDGVKLGETCEDKDRRLEDGNAKIYGKTAIPRGRYRVQNSFSHHFGKILPEVLDVPHFSGIRVHGGNTAADSLGCVLLGSVRTANGVARCAGPLERLMAMIDQAEEAGESVYLAIQ